MRTAEACPPIGEALVVDGNVIIQDFMKTVLDGIIQVDAAFSGREALRRLAAGDRFDIIISSFVLSDMTGLELLQAAASVAPSMRRFLMSSGIRNWPAIEQAIADGIITRFVSKPFKPALLRKQLIHDLKSLRTGNDPKHLPAIYQEVA